MAFVLKMKRQRYSRNRPCTKLHGRFCIQWSIPVLFLVFTLSVRSLGNVIFRDAREELGIAYRHTAGVMERKDYIFETKGGGLMVVDVDRDDIPELYFITATTRDLRGKAESPRNAFYKRMPDGRYKECAKEAGLDAQDWGMGGCAADMDNDGDIDLYVTNFGANRLFINNGKGAFTEEADKRGAQCVAMSTGASFGDADGDGFADLYVCHYINWNWETIPTGPERFGNWRGMTVHAGPRGLPKAPDKLFHNRGDGSFEDWTAYCGIANAAPQFGFQSVWFDADGDGDLDIFVSNDSCPNYLFINDGKGHFKEEAMLRGVAYSNDGAELGSMGVDLDDVNRDGIFDIVMTTWAEENDCLYLSQSPGIFEDRALAAGFGSETTPLVGWGVSFLDFDNDGDSDLFIANGHVFPEADRPGIGSSFRQPVLLYENNGNGVFRNVTEECGFSRYPNHVSRGTAIGDLDNDGDLDIAVQNLNEPPSIWINEGGSQAGNWLRVRCDASPTCNSIGAVVEITIGSNTQRRIISSGKSVFSQSEMTAHFGVGQTKTVDHVVVRSLNGKTYTFENVPANQLLVVRFEEK